MISPLAPLNMRFNKIPPRSLSPCGASFCPVEQAVKEAVERYEEKFLRAYDRKVARRGKKKRRKG